MNYHDALNYIYSFTDYAVNPATAYAPEKFDLARVERLLAALGNPHKKFQAVHIAGTKGKGSTTAMIESVLRAANYFTGMFTSPHLHTFRERIRVGGEMIAQDEVVAGVGKLQPLVAQIPGLSTFDIITALAFDYFAVRGVEIAVLEVGLGGRLDATNVVLPRVSIITSISYDHMAILGNTLAQIAREKAGIIKPGVSVVSAPQRDEALRVIQDVAREKDASLIAIMPELEFQVAGFKFKVVRKQQSLDAQRILAQSDNPNFELSTFNLKLLGRHQTVNATTALATLLLLREQGVQISPEAARDGLETVKWRGRFEVLAQHPFVIADGAHNADSAHQLIQTLRELFPRTRLHFIFGASNDKDIAGMFAELLPQAESLILTRSHNPRAADPTSLAQLAAEYHIGTSIALDLASALREAQQRASKADIVCVTGSLFVVGEAREAWFAERGIQLEKDF